MDVALARAVGQAARTARNALSLTQEDTAERIGVSTEFYARIERGRALPSVPTLVRMSAALGVSVDQLVGRSRVTGAAEQRAAWRPVDGPELRKVIRRLRRAKPRTVALINALVKELEGGR